MTKLFHDPGFLGTRANFIADVTLILGVVVAVLFSVGFYLARRKNYTAHRWVQTAAAALNLILVGWLMVLPFRSFIIEDQGGPRDTIFYAVTITHAMVGSIGLIFGLFVALRGNGLMIKPLRFNNYKLFMRTSYSLYMLATILGIIVYITWFIIIPDSQRVIFE